MQSLESTHTQRAPLKRSIRWLIPLIALLFMCLASIVSASIYAASISANAQSTSYQHSISSNTQNGLSHQTGGGTKLTSGSWKGSAGG